MSTILPEVKNRVDNFVTKITNPKIAAVHCIQTVALRAMQNYMIDKGFVQLMPLLLSPITDPLNHSVYPAAITYEERPLKLTASMIFHKQLALIAPDLLKIFIISPNIRLEKSNLVSSNNHLIEFSQFDFEIRDATMDDTMDMIEGLLISAFSAVEEHCENELALLDRILPRLSRPFQRFNTEDHGEMSIDEYCDHLSRSNDMPVFVTNFKREFYDRENPDKPGKYCNFDLIYPEGFGEGLSGAEREYTYESITRRMDELNMDKSLFENYLILAERGVIPRTAGAGLEVQRLLKFISGQHNIADVCMFDRSVTSDFIF